MTKETTMTNEEEAQNSMDQLSEMMKDAALSLANFCQEHGLQPQAWFNTRASETQKSWEPRDTRGLIKGDQDR